MLHPSAQAPPQPQPSRRSTKPTDAQARLISQQLRGQATAAPAAAPLQLGDEGAGRQRVVERDAGPVVVRVLGAEQRPAASQSAREFLQQRLQAGVKRSAQMLRSAHALQPGWMRQRDAAHQAAAQRQRPKAQPAAAVAGAPQAKRRR